MGKILYHRIKVICFLEAVEERINALIGTLKENGFPEKFKNKYNQYKRKF